MKTPRLEIDTKKLTENVRFELELLGKSGISIMGVNKVFNGFLPTAMALVEGGIQVIAESRIENLKKIHQVQAKKCLLRSPAPSEIKEAVQWSDISLNTEGSILEALSIESLKQNRVHEVLLMVDMGDLREGIWFEDRKALVELVKKAKTLPHLKIYGIGTNFNCFGAIKPTAKNAGDFLNLARWLENECQVVFPNLSAGNCTSYCLVDQGIWPTGLNHLRIGGLHQFGIEYVAIKYVEGFHHSKMPIERVCSPLFKLKAEILEINYKPTVPVGEPGVDAFLQPKSFHDRGIRKRALLSLGRQDVPIQNCWPSDESISIIGQTSDHTLIDIEDSQIQYQLGDLIEFELDYTALLYACNSPGLEKVAIG